jgi:hypothetical protein
MEDVLFTIAMPIFSSNIINVEIAELNSLSTIALSLISLHTVAAACFELPLETRRQIPKMYRKRFRKAAMFFCR